MDGFVSLDAESLTASQLYDVLTLAIQPRPIAFVSTLSAEGHPNLAPFSFFMPGGANPPSLALSVSLGSGGRQKDTLRNVEATREFVVNTVTRAMADGMNATSYSFPPEVSEWERSGFTAVASERVQPARVAESPFQFECRLFTTVPHGSGAGAAVYVIGEVVRVHVLETHWNGTNFVAGDFAPLSRMGGANYLDVSALEVFELARPTGPNGS